MAVGMHYVGANQTSPGGELRMPKKVVVVRGSCVAFSAVKLHTMYSLGGSCMLCIVWLANGCTMYLVHEVFVASL